MMKTEELKLTQEWDKTFPKSDKVAHKKVTFINHFGITLAADMYAPRMRKVRFPLSQYPDLLGRARNSPPDYMRRRWRSAAS